MSYFVQSDDSKTMIYQYLPKGEDGYVYGDNYGIIFDGHGGNHEDVIDIVKLCCERLPQLLDELPIKNIENNIEKIFQYFDQSELYEFRVSGTTVAGYVIVDKKVYFFWLGDSEIFIKFKSGEIERITQNRQHNLSNPKEKNRVIEMFGSGAFYKNNDKRLYNSLMVTGSLGNSEQKQNAQVSGSILTKLRKGEIEVSAIKQDPIMGNLFAYDLVKNIPDIEVRNLSDIDFIMLCSDGLIEHVKDITKPMKFYNNTEKMLKFYSTHIEDIDGYIDDITCLISTFNNNYDICNNVMSWYHIPHNQFNKTLLEKNTNIPHITLPGWFDQYTISDMYIKNGRKMVEKLEEVYQTPFVFAVDFSIYPGAFQGISNGLSIFYLHKTLKFKYGETAYHFGKLMTLEENRKNIDNLYEEFKDISADKASKLVNKYKINIGKWDNGKTNNILSESGFRVTWMEKILRAKLKNNLILNFLVNTKDNIIMQIKPTDPFWGSGSSDSIETNMLGRLWMALRNEYKSI